jgi:light-regulated signal transduction histidine kinase (bacteriophytochrome)
MKKLLLILLLLFGINNAISQNRIIDPETQIVWVNGIPTCPDDSQITALINKVGIENLQKSKRNISKNEANVCRQLGKIFRQKDMYEGADWYLERVKAHVEIVKLEPEVVFQEEVPADIAASLQSDKAFLQSIPKSFENVSPTDMKKLAQEIEGQLQKLIKEKEALIKSHAAPEVIQAKEASINTLGKEKEIIDLTVETKELEVKTGELKQDTKKLQNYLIGAGIAILLMALGIMILFQRKTIKVQDKEIQRQLDDINKKNTYLEYAARIIRHDMHSGINTYIPRGLSSLQKRISAEKVDELKIGSSLKMISEGLAHTQKVYKGVYEFTNLVKVKVDFKKEKIDVKSALEDYFANTSYSSQVIVEDIGEMEVNKQLFCTAIDNLVRNGIKYNTNKDKMVHVFKENNNIVIKDNGTGLSKKQFNETIKKGVNIESETGLGLSITKAIVEEHGFSIDCDLINEGTQITITI